MIVVTWTELRPLLKGCAYIAGTGVQDWVWAGALKHRYGMDRPLDAARSLLYGRCLEEVGRG